MDSPTTGSGYTNGTHGIQRVMRGADKEDREAAQNLQLNWKNGTIAKRQATALAQWLHAARASAINLTISDHSPSCEASSIVSMLPEDGSDAYFAPPVAGLFLPVPFRKAD